LLGSLFIDNGRIHDPVTVCVGKGMDEHCVDQAEHRRGRAYAQRQREDGNHRGHGLPRDGTKSEANISTYLVEKAKADRFSIPLVLRVHLAHLQAGPTASFFFGYSALHQVLRVRVEMKL
jgi:hypothetical protein